MFGQLLIVAVLFMTGHAAANTVESTPARNEDDANFLLGKKAVDAKDWNGAIVAFKKVLAREPRSADAHNYLGYAYRSSGQLDAAFRHYREALRLDPGHRGAHEYIGIAFLNTHQPAMARQHLASLEKICGKKCEEYEDLSRAIAAYKPAASATVR